MKQGALSSEKIAQAKLLYDSGVTPITEILALLGVSAGRFRQLRKEHGWPLRASPIARRGSAPARPQTPTTSTCDQLIARIEEAVEREFDNAEASLARQGPKTTEQSARTLASLVKTLAELKRMKREADAAGEKETDGRSGDGGCGDEPPRQLAELRAELARRLERLRGEGAAG